MGGGVSLSQLRVLAVVVAVPIAACGGLALSQGAAFAWLAHGPIQSGHAGIDCAGCHAPAPGSVRQQLQANLAFYAGARETEADFGYAPVTSERCLDCHDRPNERHPIYRFNEPRFHQAVQTVNAASCLGCHDEHRARRVSVGPDTCRHCHKDVTLKADPLDVSHRLLSDRGEWETCLGCHDFHGNHKAKPPVTLAQAISPETVRAYLADGDPIYGTQKLYKAERQ